jgi:hypothetical protein
MEEYISKMKGQISAVSVGKINDSHYFISYSICQSFAILKEINLSYSLHSNFFCQNSFKNGRKRAVEYPPPILVEYRPNWAENFPNWPKKLTMSRISANLKFNCARSTVFDQMLVKKFTVYKKYEIC